MIDANSLMSTIQVQISKDVDQITRQYVEHQVNQLTLDANWLEKIDGHVRDAISRLLNKQIRDIDLAPKIQAEIDQISTMIQALVSQTAEQCVEQYVQGTVQALAADQVWISKMEQHINESVARRFGQRLSAIDITDMVVQAIEPAVAFYFDKKRAAGHGVNDQATSTQLELQDDCVRVLHALETQDVAVSGDARIAKTLTVQNLAVLGTVNTDNKTWQELSTAIAQQTESQLDQQWRGKMIESVIDSIKTNGINFDSIKIGNQQLIEGDALADGITRSGLTQLGTLGTLKVSGAADIGGSLAVRPRRVGINTEHPDMALAVWDEEVALVFGKQKEQTAYIGTLRPQRLTIGVNRQAAIDIDDRGRVSLNHLTVGRHRVCHEPECPNYSGTKGDIVFNSNPKNDGIWGWQCLGAFRWVPLRTA